MEQKNLRMIWRVYVMQQKTRKGLHIKVLAMLLALILSVTPLVVAAPADDYVVDYLSGDAEIYLTANQEAWLDLINYDNIVDMARRLSEYPFGSRVGASWRYDMTVTYLMDTLESWGYKPWIHEFDATEPHLNAAGNMVSSPNRRFNNGWVQIGSDKYMLYGPTFAAGSVYQWAVPDGSITANATGSVFLEWPSIPFRGNMNIGGQGGRPTTLWGEVASDYYVAGGPTATTAAAAFTGTFLAENGVAGALDPAIDVDGKVVFVQLGSGATPHVRGVWHPNATQVYETVVLLQAAGAAAVVFQSRPARTMFISPFTPFYNDIDDRSTWTQGDSVHGRLASQGSGTPITIPVGLTTHQETDVPFRALEGDEAVSVHMETRSDGQNVLAEWTSSNPDARNIYLASHPDSVVSAPGFNDTILTTAFSMEIMRVLAEYNIELDNNVRIGAWDMEENGLLGARYYVTHMTDAEQEAFWGNFNMDMIASGQPELNYMHVNVTTPTFAQADAAALAVGQRPVGNFQFYLREIQDDMRLRDHPDALAYASQFGVWANSMLAAQQLAQNGRHEHRQIVVDPTHHRYGEPFDIDYHFTFTWGQTTDQAPFVQAALAGARHPNLLNAMQFDWRANARGFVGGQFPAGWQPGDGAPSPALAGLGIMPVLEILYHTMGDSYALNFSRDRLEVIADIISLALYHSAEVQSDLVSVPPPPPGGGISQPQGRYEYHEAYMFGNVNGQFRPRANTTRAEVAAILVRTMVEDFEYGEYPEDLTSFAIFSDVAETNWFYWYIVWAYAEGLVQGFDNGTFRPNAPITRQEYAAMVARTGEVLEAGELEFADAAAISNWALDYVYTAVDNGWMLGDTNNNFRPGANIIRAEVATATNRILGRVDSNAALAAANLQNPAYAREFPDVTSGAWYFASVLAAANDHRNRLDNDDEILRKYILVEAD